MRSTCLAFAAGLGLLTAASSLPAQAADGDTHIIVPHYPDHFKYTTTSVNDDTQQTMGKTSLRHMKTVAQADVTKTADGGYKGTYVIQSLELTNTTPDGQPVPAKPADEMIKAFYSSLGPIEVTFDKDMAPVRIDNFDALKDKLHTAMLQSSLNKNGSAEAVYNAMFANLTAESAAKFLNQAQTQASPFNRPLVLNQTVAMSGAPLNFFGADLNLNASMTLVSWEEGKSARIHYVLAPSSDDLHNFMTKMIRTILSKSAQQPDAKTQEMFDRLMANMHMDMNTDCEIDIDLANSTGRHSDCHTTVAMSLDLSKMLTEADLKAHPDAAKSLPVVTVNSDSHAVSDTVITP